MTTDVETRNTPFERVGGRPAVQAIVDCFYDLMDSDEAFAELRRMHAPDLAPMRASLAGFLTAWMGGPRDWFVENPGKCMMSLHASVGVTDETADQWITAMRRAIGDIVVDDPEFVRRMGDALEAMARAMVRS